MKRTASIYLAAVPVWGFLLTVGIFGPDAWRLSEGWHWCGGALTVGVIWSLVAAGRVLNQTDAGGGAAADIVDLGR
jgi:hypothetical protein